MIFIKRYIKYFVCFWTIFILVLSSCLSAFADTDINYLTGNIGAKIETEGSYVGSSGGYYWPGYVNFASTSANGIKFSDPYSADIASSTDVKYSLRMTKDGTYYESYYFNNDRTQYVSSFDTPVIGGFRQYAKVKDKGNKKINYKFLSGLYHLFIYNVHFRGDTNSVVLSSLPVTMHMFSTYAEGDDPLTENVSPAQTLYAQMYAMESEFYSDIPNSYCYTYLFVLDLTQFPYDYLTIDSMVFSTEFVNAVSYMDAVVVANHYQAQSTPSSSFAYQIDIGKYDPNYDIADVVENNNSSGNLDFLNPIEGNWGIFDVFRVSLNRIIQNLSVVYVTLSSLDTNLGDNYSSFWPSFLAPLSSINTGIGNLVDYSVRLFNGDWTFPDLFQQLTDNFANSLNDTSDSGFISQLSKSLKASFYSLFNPDYEYAVDKYDVAYNRLMDNFPVFFQIRDLFMSLTEYSYSGTYSRKFTQDKKTGFEYGDGWMIADTTALSLPSAYIIKSSDLDLDNYSTYTFYVDATILDVGECDSSYFCTLSYFPSGFSDTSSSTIQTVDRFYNDYMEGVTTTLQMTITTERMPNTSVNAFRIGLNPKCKIKFSNFRVYKHDFENAALMLEYRGNKMNLLDFSWYLPYKHIGDVVIIAFAYILFCWRLFKKLPSMLR